jgi:rRNA-processing protein FCF1
LYIQVILDGNFIYTALKFNIDLHERLKKTLQGETLVFYVTESSLEELRTLGEKGMKALQYAQIHCTAIDDKPYAGEEPNDKLVTFLGMIIFPMELCCIEDDIFHIVHTADRTLQKTRRYFVATQDQELRNYIAGVVTGVPILYLNKGE